MRNIYKYSFILGLVLLFTSILFLSFKLEDKPSTSKTPDEYIASYIEGEYQTAIPGKDDGYVVDKIVCDNGATATWNTDEWGIDIRNATQKVKCSIYFIKTVKLTDKITTLAATDSTNFATDDPDNNIRYIGKDPNNYVYFNCSDYTNQTDDTCEKWRIIGLFNNMTKEDGTKENLIKIIRDESIGSLMRKSDWTSTKYFQSTLNAVYYDGTFEGCYLKTEDTYGNCSLKNDNTRNAIENVVWNLGETDSAAITAEEFYKIERGDQVYEGHATTWTGKIANMYPSDYGYATSGNSTTDRSVCLTASLADWNNYSDCYNNNYLFKSSDSLSAGAQWTLTSKIGDMAFHTGIFFVSSEGNIGRVSNGSGRNDVFPTLYLKSNISITSGEGTSSNPYQLSLN